MSDLSSAYITQHFSWAEAQCHDGTDVPEIYRANATKLAETMEKIRKRWGGPLTIISWYRSPKYNANVGGALGSRHITAEAADIRPVIVSRVADLNMLIEDMLRDGDLPDLGGIGRYSTWVHVDVRRKINGHIARWTGRGVGSETA